MPYEWVDPEKFLEHEGITVYHAHDDDNMVSTFWYTVDETNSNIDSPDDTATMFDVRDIQAATPQHSYADHRDDIRYAIGIGWLTQEGLKLPDGQT